jgi:Fur family transcriptional regulator, ferric uptake regulator
LTKTAPPAHLPKNYELLRTILDAEPAVHHTVHDIFLEAKRRNPKIGYATVHRGLARLHELGFVLKIDLPGRDAAWYETAAPAHAHLLCASCHRIVDVRYQVAPRVLAGLESRDGVEITSEIVVFRGRCRECLESAEASRR